MALLHDVSGELRGKHGEWTKGGAALHRMGEEAKKTAAARPKAGDRVKYKTGSLGTVHHVDDKGTPHVVWDRGRGKPVATPAHHLTSIAGEKKQAETTEKAAREVTSGPKIPAGTPSEESLKGKTPEQLAEMANIARGQGNYPGKELTLQRIRSEQVRRQAATAPKPGGYKPTRQAGSRGGVPAPTTGPDLKTRPFHEVHAEYQARNQTLQRALQNPGRYGPGVIPSNKRQVEKLDAELRAMGARKTGQGFEMPPKAGTPEHAAEQLKNDIASVTEQLHDQHHEAGAPLYSAKELAQLRSRDIMAQMNTGEKRITVKVPSGSEITMDRATARELLNMPAEGRQKVGAAPAGMTPELQAQLRDIQAAEKARVEASNKARFPGGSLTRNTQAGVGVGPPILAGGATPPKTAQRITATEKQALSNITGTPVGDIHSGNIESIRAKAKAQQSNVDEKGKVRKMAYLRKLGNP